MHPNRGVYKPKYSRLLEKGVLISFIAPSLIYLGNARKYKKNNAEANASAEVGLELPPFRPT